MFLRVGDHQLNMLLVKYADLEHSHVDELIEGELFISAHELGKHIWLESMMKCYLEDCIVPPAPCSDAAELKHILHHSRRSLSKCQKPLTCFLVVQQVVEDALEDLDELPMGEQCCHTLFPHDLSPIQSLASQEIYKLRQHLGL